MSTQVKLGSCHVFLGVEMKRITALLGAIAMLTGSSVHAQDKGTGSSSNNGVAVGIGLGALIVIGGIVGGIVAASSNNSSNQSFSH
jgi:hypothetical protein